MVERKPLHFVLGEHAEDSVHHLEPFRAAIVSQLEQHPKGKVAVFVEDYLMDSVRAEFIRSSLAYAFSSGKTLG